MDAVGFAFAFGGDDIHESTTESIPHADTLPNRPDSSGPNDSNVSNGRQARVQDLREMLESLPSQITYSSLELINVDGGVFLVPKRDYADVRVQMMAEDEGEYSAYLSGSDDIKENEYEGGFKTWECAVDLATLALQMRSNGDRAKYGNIIELGCGSAIPTLVMFQNALQNNQSPSTFTLADYNEEVLRLLTVPNLLLNWAVIKRNPTESPEDLQTPTSPLRNGQEEKERTANITHGANYGISNNDTHNHLLSSSSGNLEITPGIITAFLSDLEAYHIGINLISGSWQPGDKFAYLLPSTSSSSSSSIPISLFSKTLILSSETIYSPKSLLPFVDILETVLRQQQQQHHHQTGQNTTNGDGATAKGEEDEEEEEEEAESTGKALVATKRLYFGVGGGVDAFINEMRERGMLVQEVEKEIGTRDRTKSGNNDNNSSSNSSTGVKDIKREKSTTTSSVSRCIVQVNLPPSK